MDILIPNLELPLEERIQLSIYPNGVVVNHSTLKIGKTRTTAIELLPHGDLKDANIILQWLNLKADNQEPVTVGEIIDFIEKQPTVLEASE